MNASSVPNTPAGLVIPTSALQAIKPAVTSAPGGAASGNSAVGLTQILSAANQGGGGLPLMMPMDKTQVLTLPPQTDHAQLLRQLPPGTVIINPPGLQSVASSVTSVPSLTSSMASASVLSKTSAASSSIPMAQTGIMQTVSPKGTVGPMQVGTIIPKGRPVSSGALPLPGISVPLQTLQLPVLAVDGASKKQALECSNPGMQLTSTAGVTSVSGQAGNVIPLTSQANVDNALAQALYVAMGNMAQPHGAVPATKTSVSSGQTPVTSWITSGGIIIPASSFSGLEVHNLSVLSGAVATTSTVDGSHISQPLVVPQVVASGSGAPDVNVLPHLKPEASSVGVQSFTPSSTYASLALSSSPTLTLNSPVATSRAPPSYAASTSALRSMQPGSEAQYIQEISQMLRNSADNLTAQQARDSVALSQSSALERQIPEDHETNSADQDPTLMLHDKCEGLTLVTNGEQQYPLDLHLERVAGCSQLENASNPTIITIEVQRDDADDPGVPNGQLVSTADPSHIPPDLGHQDVQLHLTDVGAHDRFSPGIFSVIQSVPQVSGMSLEGTYCVDCNAMLSEPCPRHGPVQCYIRDTPVLSMARRSLPTLLYLKYKAGNPNGKVVGVYCREEVGARTKFGPLIAAVCNNENGYPKYSFLKLLDTSGPVTVAHTLDMQNEDQGNWLIFLRRAWPNEDHNVVAYHENNAIYFVTRETVAPGRELLYWPSKDYATYLNVPESPHMYQRSEPLLPCVLETEAPLSDSNKWKCMLCPMVCATEAKLRSHKRIHRPRKLHSCEQCGKAFSDKSNLQAHMSIHSGARPFVCQQCSKAFRQKAHLQSHLLTHTGEKSIKCPFCDKMFARNSDLRVHESRHTLERVFVCDHPGCNKIFYKLQTFKKHKQNLHGGKKDFNCPMCSKAFHSNYHVQRHQKSCLRKEDTALLKIRGCLPKGSGGDIGKTVKERLKEKCSENQQDQEDLELSSIKSIVNSVEAENISLPPELLITDSGKS